MIPDINKNLIFLQWKRVNLKENLILSIEDNDLEQNVNFDASESGYGDDDSDTPNINIDQGFAWIVYWILKYQERYRLFDVATNSLINL